MSLDAATSAGVLERDAELEVVRRSLMLACEGVGSLVVVDGPAGVGKTTVLDAACAAASDAALVTLRARGAELERAFGFGIVRQLFEPVVRDAAGSEALFTGAARFAAPLFEVQLGGRASAPRDDQFAARHALYWLAANLASRRPLAMLVDDAHWADAASLGALAHIANRLDGLPIALVIASRPEEPHPALGAMRRHASDAGTLLRLDPLGEGATAALVRSFAPSAGERLCRAYYRATGGNPFLLGELARSLRSGDPGARDPDRVADQSPERVTREVAARLARLPDAARRLAGATAVLGHDVPLRQAAALAGIDHHEAAEAADVLVAAGVLRSAQPLEFLHPLLGAAVYERLGRVPRSVDHARAARLLAEEGAPPERVAAQLLHCEPAGDQWASDQLVVAARLASADGAADAAARYLHRALDEPPPAAHRVQILLEAAAAESMASQPGAAVEHLRELLGTDLDLDRRLRATVLLASLLGHTGRVPEAVEVLEQQIDAFGDRADLRRGAEVMLTNIAWIDPESRARARPVVERLRARVERGEEQDPAVLGAIATEMTMAGEPAAQTAALAERGLARFNSVGAGVTGWSSYGAVRTLVLVEEYDRALRVLNRAINTARERGGVMDVGAGLAFRAELYVKTGDIASAEMDARTLLEIATGYGWAIGEGFAVAWLCEVLVDRGELEEAERVAEGRASLRSAAALTTGFTAAEVLCARGRLRLAQGRTGQGIDDLRAAGRAALAIGSVSPAICAWRAQLAHALVDIGETDEARGLAAEELKLSRRLGAPRALAVALRAGGRVAGGEQELRMLREAIDLLAASPARLECARAHAALGAALRASGDAVDAREPLRVAVDLAHRCGAQVLEDQALEELRATGARPRRRAAAGADALTPSERRIAELAAGGQQNREIAEGLFVTAHTIEFHLRNAYRKLGITSRTQLADALRPAKREPEAVEVRA